MKYSRLIDKANGMLVFLMLLFVGCQKNGQNPVHNENQLSVEESTPVQDYDGNIYRTIQVGNQIWMLENLRTTHFSDGSPVQSVAFENDTSHVITYGRLYKWSEFMRNQNSTNTNTSEIQGVAPSGWHIPSDSEWLELIENLGGETVAGGKLKEAGFLHWDAPNTGATDEIGFRALPAGFFDFTGNFVGLGRVCFFATATAESPWEIYVRELNSTSASMERGGLHPEDAIPVRCVKNAGSR